MSLEKLVTDEIISPADADVVWNALKNNSSVIITGKTAAGKTSFAKALLQELGSNCIGLYSNHERREYTEDQNFNETKKFIFHPALETSSDQSLDSISLEVDVLLVDELDHDNLKRLPLLSQTGVPLIVAIHGTESQIEALLPEDAGKVVLVEVVREDDGTRIVKTVTEL